MILITKRIKRKEKLNTILTVSKPVIAAFIMALIPVSEMASNVEAINTKSSDFGLRLAKDSHNLVEVTEAKVAITVGESIADRDVRLAKEKAEAEAAAKANASRQVVARERVVKTSVPENIDLTGVYKSAASAYGIADWRYLKAIHYVETGCAIVQEKRSGAGATGPMQFLPSTWRRWGVDGNGDGVADINNVIDAIHGAARYLQVSGGSSDIRQALYSYNHSTSYVNKVTNVALSIVE
jgi:hypothetical protein